MGRRVTVISGSLIGQKPLRKVIFTPVLNFGEVRRAQIAKSTLLISTQGPLGSFQIFKVCSNAEESVGCGKHRKTTASIHP